MNWILAQQWRQECEHFVVCEPSRLETEDDQHGEKRLHAPVAKAQRGSTLAIDLDRLHHLIKGILTDEAIVGDLLDIQQTSIGSKADLPQSGQILRRFPMEKSRVSLMVVSVRSARPSL